MRRQVVQARIASSAIDFIDHVAEMNSVSRSKVVEMLAFIVNDYFSDEQLKMEYNVRKHSEMKDGRKARG
jgi:hypothetical protein